MGDRTRGRTRESDMGADYEVGLRVGLGGGSDWRGRTGGIGLGGSNWGVGRGRTGAFHVQKRIKHFFFRNYTKILLNLVNFSLPLQFPPGRC